MTNSVTIVGGAGAIGQAIARELIYRQAVVTVADIQPLPPHCGISASFLNCDVLKDRDLERLASSPTTHLISLAGGAVSEEFDGTRLPTTEALDRSLDLNLRSHAHLLRHWLSALPKCADHDRSVTFVSSVNAIRCFGLLGYSAAKAGLLGLVAGSADQCGDLGVRVNAVLPGTVPTPRTLRQPKDFDALRRHTLLGRLATCDEIAKVVASVVLDFTCVTAQSIIADCGQTMKI